MTKQTVLSGIQPTGTLHIGNYVGALRLWVERQAEFDNLLFIADLHALTIPETVRPQHLRQTSRETAALFIACGIDPEQSVIFLQSDVCAHPYLAWILSCCTPVGWLERMTQYKTKSAALETASSGLLNYPVLQAADILIYKPDFVPVGDDQTQHIEITRDIARRFNRLFGECFPIPEQLTRASGARIMGFEDPNAKMSKSLAETRRGHAVSLLDSPDEVRKTVMAAVTDAGSEVRFEQASPGVKNLLTLYEALSGEDRPAIEARFAGKGYSALKRELVELLVATLQPIQAQYRQIMEDCHYLDDVLARGAARARAIAERTLADVRRLTGV